MHRLWYILKMSQFINKPNDSWAAQKEQLHKNSVTPNDDTAVKSTGDID